MLYTLRSDTEKAENKRFSVLAYITVDGQNYFYSDVNSDINSHEGIRLLAADTNRDGTIDVSDATTLQMFIADYQLTYPISEKISVSY